MGSSFRLPEVGADVEVADVEAADVQVADVELTYVEVADVDVADVQEMADQSGECYLPSLSSLLL